MAWRKHLSPFQENSKIWTSTVAVPFLCEILVSSVTGLLRELDSWEVGCPWGSCVPMWQCKFSTWVSSLCRAVSEHWLTLTAQHCEWMGSCVHLLHQSSIRVLFHVPLLMESWWNLIKESRCIRIFFLTFLGQFLSNYTLLKAIDFSCLPRYNLVHINVVYLPQLKHHIQVWANKLLMNGMLKTTPSYWRQFIFSCSLRYNLV